MARQCQLLGKKTKSGQNRPFSLKATKRTFRPNLFMRKVLNPLTGRVERMKLSGKAIKTIKKWSKAALGTESIEEKKTQSVSNKGEGKHLKKEKKLTPKQKKEALAKKEAEALGKTKTKEKK